MRWEPFILKTGGLLSPLECEELAHFAATITEHNALEVGNYTGLSTLVLWESLTVPLFTIDDHKWRDTARAFTTNVPHDGLDLYVIDEPFERALPKRRERFSFVFYDADHDATSIAKFMELIAPLLAEHVVLCFDDADWPAQDHMRELAEALGFVDVTRRPFHRHQLAYSTGDEQYDLDLAKRHPDTYTLRVMQR